MNAIFFEVKRAFHATLQLTRKALTAMGLTAARFDMLTVISRYADEGVRQSALREWLGVTGATISRMLRSLEELGLIVRERIAKDRRRLLVRLTVAGSRLIRRASRLFIHSGAIQLAVESALCGEQVFDEGECLLRVESAEVMLWSLEAAFERQATLHYPWHPDD